MKLKITILKLQLHLPGVNELNSYNHITMKLCSTVQTFLIRFHIEHCPNFLEWHPKLMGYALILNQITLSENICTYDKVH